MPNRLIQPPPKTLPTPASTADAATDGELLMRFSRHGDQGAFAEVVERHHAMIWGVCSRVLVRRADAEDAYQATLLILAKKSKAIRANDSAGGWLFRVAHNAALGALRRRKALRETPLEELSLPPEAPFPDLEQKQLAVALLEELRAMSAKYQTPLVLRYLQGQSRRQIAAAMEVTVATVAGHLVRGRRMLRSRLARRGVSLAAGLGAFGVGSTSYAASTIHGGPPAFDPVSVSTTLSTTASAAVQQLVTQGVRAMFFGSLTKPAAIGLAASLVAAVLIIGSQDGVAQSASESAGEPALQLGLSVPQAMTDESQPASVQLLVQDNQADNSGGGGAAPGITRADAQATGASAEAQSAPATQAVDSEITGVVVPAEAAEISKAFERQKARYAKMAAAEGPLDYTTPSFEELYWHRNHWLAKQDALVTRMKNLEQMRERLARKFNAGESNLDENVRLFEDELQTRADLPLAKAKIAEYERLMKQAALRETSGPTDFQPKVQSGQQSKLTGSEYRKQAGGGPIQIGEHLMIEVYDRTRNKEVYSSEVTVDEDGDIAFDSQWGRISVVNLPIRTIETKVRGSFYQEQRELQTILAKNDPDYVMEPVSFSALVRRVQGSDSKGAVAKPKLNQGFAVPGRSY